MLQTPRPLDDLCAILPVRSSSAAAALLEPPDPMTSTVQDMALLRRHPALLHPEDGRDLVARSTLLPLLARVRPEWNSWAEVFGLSQEEIHQKWTIQSWLANWYAPPSYIVLNHPFRSDGSWYRLFRSTVHVARELAGAETFLQRNGHSAFRERYEIVLGVGAASCFDTPDSFEDEIRRIIRGGTWHVARYAPEWQGFIPLDAYELAREAGSMARMEANEVLVSETTSKGFAVTLPPVPVYLYPAPTRSREIGFRYYQAVQEGGFVDLLGTRNDVAPFGEFHTPSAAIWPGIPRICGLIQVLSTGCHPLPLAQAQDKVVLLPQDPYALLRQVWEATGWAMDGWTEAFEQPQGDLAVTLNRENAGKVVILPEEVAKDFLLGHPEVFPVFDRLVSPAKV